MASRLSCFASALALASFAAMGGTASAETLTLWSHWADQQAKVKFVEDAARAFEAAHPGISIEITWYQKEPLYAALKTALIAGEGPDIFYAEPDQVEYMQNGLILDLSEKLDWNNIEPWAKEVWGYEGGVYGFPLEAWTVELYYNTKMLADLGFALDEGTAFEGETFVELVRKAKAAGITPMSEGVGDRPYPGAFLTHEILVKQLGVDDYRSLLLNQGVTWDDPRVYNALTFAEEIISAGAFPSSFSSLKLGEAHYYFHTKPGAVMFQMGSFYPSRAFQSPDDGGQPVGFPLGVMNSPVPANAACPNCKTIAVGGSFVVNAASEHANLAAEFLNSMATPEMGNAWLEANLVQTGIKADPSKITGDKADYFQKLAAANKDVTYVFGIPVQIMQGQPKEVFTQVINQAFPAGLIGVDEVIEQMKAAY